MVEPTYTRTEACEEELEPIFNEYGLIRVLAACGKRLPRPEDRAAIIRIIGRAFAEVEKEVS